jgi:D-beta-D-heptose 7-phosphate kinase/D-beta-D-heptose 1-phosphate adenosyltransferase
MAILLILGLNSDASIRRLKGEKRPLIDQHERAHILAALDCIDYLVIFDEDTPIRLLETLRPDVLVKGGDYTPDRVVGKDLVELRWQDRVGGLRGWKVHGKYC